LTIGQIGRQKQKKNQVRRGPGMTKAGFWKTDWFLGVAVVISVVLFNCLSDLIMDISL
jgi:hypothetical protein